MKKKILIIGLDGGSWKLYDELIKDGYMPFLASLRESGASGNLISTIPPQTPVAWGAFQTGMKPGDLGYVDFVTLDLENNKLGIVNGKNLPKTIWEYFSEQGKKVVSLNVPMTFPPRKVNGVIISGMLTPGIDSNFIYPRNFKTEFLNNNPSYHIFQLSRIKKDFSYKEIDRYLLELRKIIDTRKDAALYLFDKEDPDLMMVHFQVTDILQHPYWKKLDKNHKDYSSEAYNNIGNNFYKFLDNRLQSMVNQIKSTHEDLLVTIISDHGFQPHDKRINLGDFLSTKNYCIRNLNSSNSFKSLTIRALRKFDLLGILKKVFKDKWLNAVEKATQPILWSKSKVIAIGRSSYGFIYINEKLVKDKNSFKKELIKNLEELNQLGTRKVINTIFTKEELYKGSRLDSLPDLIIVPEPGITFSGSFSDQGKGDLLVEGLEDFHQGIHHLKGIYIFAGDGINKNFKSDISIIDVFPTLSMLAGLPTPETDGKRCKELVNEG